jgi:hypothetical protein
MHAGLFECLDMLGDSLTVLIDCSNAGRAYRGGGARKQVVTVSGNGSISGSGPGSSTFVLYFISHSPTEKVQ